MSFSKSLAQVIFLVLGGLVFAQQPTIDLGPAMPYNGFFFENFTSNGSDTQGRLAIGHTGSLKHYSVGDQLSSATAGDVLVVGGNLAFPTGRVYFGNIVVGGQANAVGNAVLNGLAPGATLQAGVAVPVDFSGAASQLTTLSQELAQLPTNTTYQIQWGGLYLHGDGSSELQVFNLPGDEVLDAHTFEVDGIPADAWVLFNIAGVQTGLTHMSLTSLQAHRSRVLFNFHQANNLKLRGIGVEGSVLAPFAHVANPQGVLHGQIVAKSWNGKMQLNHVAFEPFDPKPINDPPQFTSTPGTTATVSGTYTYDAEASDPNGDVLTFAVTAGPVGFAIDAVTGVTTWTPLASQVGVHPVTLTVTDPDGLSDSQSYQITVEAALNQPPQFTSMPVTEAIATQAYSYQTTATDPENQLLTFNVITGPLGLSIDSGTGLVSWVPLESQLGNHSVILEVADSDGLADTQSFSITVREPPNREPGFTSTPVTSATATLAYSYQATAEDPDGDVLTFSVVNGPLGLNIDSVAGLVSWVPNEHQVGDHPVTLQVSDPEGLTDTQTFAITVAEPPNRPPSFTSTPITAATATLPYSYQATATDLDSDVLAFSLVSGPTGLVIDPSAGLVSWAPDESQVGDHPVTLQVVDPEGLTDVQTFTIAVAEPPNRPPSFTSTPITGATTTLPYSYQATATDPDNDLLTFSLVSGPSGLGMDPSTGLVNWTPDESQVGDHPVTLQVADPEGLTDIQTFTIAVAEPPNRPPSFTSTPITDATATLPYTYQATATDPDNDVLAYSLVSGPAGLSIDPSSGFVSWTSDESQVGDHAVTLQVADPDGLFDTQSFTITVAEQPNRTPYFTSTPILSATIQQLFRYDATAADPDADVLTFRVIDGPQGFFINATTGAVSWTPANDQGGSNAVTLEVSDPGGLADIQAFIIDVALPENRSPQITSLPINPHLLQPTTGQGTSLNLEPWQTFLFTNTGGPDGDPEWTFNEDFTDTIQIRNARASVLLSDNDFPYGQVKGTMRVGSTSDDDYIGIVFGWQNPRNFYLFDWKAGTQSGSSGPALQGMNLKLYQSDPQTPGFPLPWATEPVTGQGFNLYHNNIAWQSNRDYDFELEYQPGEISITVRQGATVLDSFTVYDDSLTAGRFGFYNYSQGNVTYNGFTSETAASHAFDYQATATDPDGDPLQWTLLDGPENLTLDANTGVLTWNTTRQDVGNYPVRIRVEDGKGGADEQIFELRVVDEIPSITSQAPPSARCGQLYIYDVSAVDPNPLPVFRFELLVNPTGMTIEGATGRISWTPDLNQKGVHTVHVRLSDEDGHTDEQIFEIYVVPSGNQPPVVTSLPPIDAFVGAAYHYQIEAFDPEGDGLFFNLAEAPTGLLLDPSTGFVSWTPNAQQLGERRVRLNVWDTVNQFTEHVFTLLVQANEAPVFTSIPVTSASEGSAYTYLVTANDADGDDVALRLLEGPEGMIFDAITSTISWVPTGSQAGPHPVSLEARDSHQAAILQTFTVTVAEAVDGNPIITSTPILEAVTGSAYAYQIEAFDPEGLLLSYQLSNNPTGMTLNASGLVAWTPSGSQAGVHQVTVEVEDPAGNAASQTFLLDVSQTVNTSPSITSLPLTDATATLAYTYQVLAEDADGDALIFFLDEGPTGLNIEPSTGFVTWTPTEAQVGDHPLALRVDDGQGGQDVQSFTITVAPFVVSANDAPVFTSNPPARVLSIGDAFAYTATATDADGDPITFSLERGPAGLSINSLSGQVQWPNAVLGSHLVVVQAADNRGGISRQSFSVNVQANGNSAPTITSTPLLMAEVGLEFEYEVKATDPDGFPFFFSLEQAPAGATIAPNSGVLRWTPTAAQVGSHNFEIRVADPLAAADTQSFTVTVNPAGDHEPPFVAVNVLTFPADPNQDVTIQVVAGDTNGLASVTLTIDGTPVVLDAQNEFIFNSPTPGAFIAEATALDIAGNQATSQSNIYIRDLSDSDNPFVEITSPARDRVLTAPTTVTGTVQDASLAAWKLEVGLKGEDCFTTIATGKTALTNAILGTLDPTLLPNGLYELRLSGTDTSGRVLTDIVSVILEGGFKVGRFTIGFRDLDWPLKGIPAQVNRVYDSTHKCPGDFGYGWDLADVRVQISAQLGEWWDLEETQFCLPLQGDPIYPPFSLCNGTPQPLWCVQHTRPHYVTVTLPDGKTEIFDLIMDVEEARECMRFFVPDGAIPTFKPRPGTTSQLRVNTGAVFFRQLQDGQGNNRWTFVDSSLEPWDPQQFELETEDGIIYQIHRTEGVKSITDLEGNSVTINANGITHSSGDTIGFTRNAKGFITQVKDPANNVTTYAYNDADDLIAVTDPEGNTVRFRYDDFHNLIEVQDPTGNIPARNEYDPDGRLIAQVDGHGNRISFDHDIAGRQELVTDAAGNLTVHVYDERGNILQTTNALGETTLYTYDAFDNELTKTIAAGTSLEATTTRTFDDKNRILSETDPLGHTVTYDYDGKGNPLSIGDALGQTVDFTYDNFARPTSITGPMGEITTTSYFIENNRLVSLTTDPLSHTTRTEEDFRGHVVREVGVRGNETLYTNDQRGNVKTQTAYRTDENGIIRPIIWQRTYDKNGRQLTETNPLGHTTVTTYDGNGRVTSETDALGNSTSYTYDARGNKVRSLFADGTLETGTWDQRGNQLTSTDRQSRTTRFHFDVENRLVRTEYPDGTETSQSYDAAGRVTAVTDVRGYTTGYEYDLAGRRTKVTDALGGETTYGYDARGNQTNVIDANGHTMTFVYDAKNRRTETVYHDGTRHKTKFDALDRQIETIDQAGISTDFRYDAAGNLIEVIDALGQSTYHAYDEQGNRTEQTDALGRTTRWAYDDGNRPVSRTLPLGMTETMAYDAAGNLATHTDFKGQVATLGYDALNRQISRTDADGILSWAYSASGLRQAVSDPRGTTTYTYDLSDRLSRVDLPEGSWLAYAYDAGGNRTSVSGPNQSTSYSFDALNRLATVTDDAGGTANYGYDAVGNRTSLMQANGVVTTYTYDPLNRLSYQETRKSDGDLITSYDYTLAPTGHRTRVVEVDGRQVDYAYDDLDRLTEESITDAVRGNETINYTLDAVGNRLSRTDANGTTVYTYDANDRIQTAGSDSFTYDANGNTLTATKAGETTTYTYDAQNRLTQAVTGATNAAFAYDIDGMRVSKETGSQTIHYLVDTNRNYGQVLEEIKDDGTASVTYTHGDGLLSQDRAGSTRYFHMDGHGSVVALTDVSEQATDTYLYDAFGESLETTGTTKNHYGYTGEQFDADLGFIYLRARYYNPTMGRFHTMDTWPGRNFDPVTLHKYLYANVDPVNMVDPSGLFSLVDIGAAETIRNIIIDAQINVGFSLFQASQGDADGAARDFIIGTASVGAVGVAAKGVKVLRNFFRAIKQFRNFENGLEVVSKVKLMAKSSDFQEMKNAFKLGKQGVFDLNGTKVEVIPGLPFSGMTNSVDNGFILGEVAFSSEKELLKTMLHESYRLRNSNIIGNAANAVGARLETEAAQSFSDTAYDLFFGGFYR